ncbi:MAG: hypothetical protein RRY35_04760, partial [Clostridiales bacterium]
GCVNMLELCPIPAQILLQNITFSLIVRLPFFLKYDKVSMKFCAQPWNNNPVDAVKAQEANH